MQSHKFSYELVVVEMAGAQIELEAHGDVDLGGKVTIDLLYYKPASSVYSEPAEDLLKIQPVLDSIVNQIKGRK